MPKIRAFSELTNIFAKNFNNEGILIVDDFLLKVQISNQSIDNIIHSKIDSLKHNAIPIYEIGKIKLYSLRY